MKERTKRLQALFCALAVTATSVGSPLVSVPVYAEETQGAEDTSEQPETESGKTTDASDSAISESPDQAGKPVELIPENPNQEPAAEDEEDSGQETTVEAETAQMPQAAAVQEAQTQEAETVTPKEGTLTVKINGTAASGESLETAVTASGTEAAAVTRLDLVSGTITQADLAYITTLTNLQDFHMQLGSGLKLIGKTGSATTVLGKNTAVLNFAPKASGSSKGELREVHLEGVTEIQKGGIVSDSVETVDLPDATEVGDDAFNGFGWLEKVSLPKAETIGMRAFYKCTRLTDVTLEAVKTLKKDSFYYTNSLKRLTLPATLETIENIQFGRVGQGNKAGTRVVMKGMTPPTVASGAFTGVSQTTISTVTVPAGALDAYLAQINAENSSAGLIRKKETMWNNLYLREEGSYAVEYYSEYVTGVKVAYVKAGEGVTAEKVASATKAGNIFKGWNTKKNGTGEAFGEGSVPTDDITVYPVFAAACTIQIHQEDGTTTKLEVEKGQAIRENLPAAPTKEGYLFKGWNTSADGTGTTVTADTVITENMDLYPIFEEDIPPVVEVRVVFDVDGQKSEVKVVKGEAIGSNLPADPEKDGYTFKGWNTKADGTGETVTAETVVTDEMEVYAVFEQNPAPIEEVKVVIDVDGVKTEVKVIKGEVIGSNLPADPTKDGYTFKGWNTKADGTGETVTAETVVTDEMEVYAVFEQNPAPIEEVKVVIDVDGVKTEVKVIKGEAIGSNLPADPTKDGYTFKGWNTKADGTGETVTAETVVTDEMEVYAVFEQNPAPIEEVKVVFDVDGVKTEVKVIKGEAIGSNLLADPTKDGYTFKGWNTKADGTGEAVTAETVVTDEMEVYAVFEQNPAPIEEVKVVFDVDGVKTEAKVIKGEAIGSNLPADPTKEGYTFKGWNTKADGTGEAVTAETVVTDEMEVYAVFEQNPAPIEEVKVVIDVDGVKSEVKVIKGEAIGSNLPADPTKKGYTFKGWNTKADGTGETVTADTLVSDDLEVYAIFEKTETPKDPEKPDPGKGDDTKKPETPRPTPTTTPANTNTTKKNNTTTGTTTPASKTTTTAQTAKSVKTADATPLASTAAAGGLSLLGILAALFGKKKK
ncbi:MAG: InlB B-repeat-containing protein [Lachnospiraceae bacterium]|nr:InlB B-repeat-containing protein [Lachnospiraceae bacterium]